MQPRVEDLRYYEGDSFTILVYAKDSTGEFIDFTTAHDPYFRLAEKRGDPTAATWHGEGVANFAQPVPGGPWCIKCDVLSITGQSIDQGYVYDVGYWVGPNRVTLLTGAFQVMSEVKRIGDLP